MAGRGLTIGIDYTDQYCQACYYSERHGRPESVSGGTDVLRYLIPSVLCLDQNNFEWVIGNAALRIEEQERVLTFRDLLKHARENDTVFTGEREYTYVQLLAAFFGQLLEFIRIRTSVMTVESITVTMKQTDRLTKDILEQAFGILQIPASCIKLLSASESFGYYILNEDPGLWQDGALVFDFSSEGFFVKQLHVQFHKDQPVICVNDYDFSADFSVDSLASEVLRNQMDLKISNLYLDLISKGENASVYFTGEGFDEQWFLATLNSISGNRRAFKGNNIYVKGACIAGHLRSEGIVQGFPIICRGRTRADIYLQAWDNGKLSDILLSPAATDWYDAGYEGDFILEEEEKVLFRIVSIMTGAVASVELDLSAFPKRPSKATRIRIRICYSGEYDCEISIQDKGFGDFFPDSGARVSRRINLEGYI
ncbi:MAG: hypothetical protein IKG67_08140 [Parasporobacterium sp.]|nr:hypothetical protein [Parasporobacterium sp.]